MGLLNMHYEWQQWDIMCTALFCLYTIESICGTVLRNITEVYWKLEYFLHRVVLVTLQQIIWNRMSDLGSHPICISQKKLSTHLTWHNSCKPLFYWRLILSHLNLILYAAWILSLLLTQSRFRFKQIFSLGNLQSSKPLVQCVSPNIRLSFLDNFTTRY